MCEREGGTEGEKAPVCEPGISRNKYKEKISAAFVFGVEDLDV